MTYLFFNTRYESKTLGSCFRIANQAKQVAMYCMRQLIVWPIFIKVWKNAKNNELFKAALNQHFDKLNYAADCLTLNTGGTITPNQSGIWLLGFFMCAIFDN